MKVLDKDELQAAEEALKKHLPKSYKVYGFLFSINRGKPTTVEVIVDKWPDFKVIICRPDLANRRVMDYPLKVTIFSTDQHVLKDMLAQEGTLDWSQNFLFGVRPTMPHYIRGPNFLVHSYFLQLFWGDPETSPNHRDIFSPVCPGSGCLPRTKGRRPGGYETDA